jgi:hypothetical protein
VHPASGKMMLMATSSHDAETGPQGHLFEALSRIVDREAIGAWLREPNPAFDGSTPLQVIERGESDRLWRMIYEMESGQPD